MAAHYAGLIDAFVLDDRDATLAHKISAMGMEVHISATVMQSLEDRERLAREVLAVAGAAA